MQFLVTLAMRFAECQAKAIKDAHGVVRRVAVIAAVGAINQAPAATTRPPAFIY